MKSNLNSQSFLLAAILMGTAAAAPAANYLLSTQSGLITPTGRGGANATYFGWDTFTGNPGDANYPNLTAAINDSTPDIGSATGALILTNNGEDHISASGNYYSSSGTTNETITAPTAGVAGSGFTTIIAQGITAFGPFGSPLLFSDIAGVAPQVFQNANAAGGAQFLALWQIPGNAPSYSFTITSPSSNSNNSLDKVIVDTFWSSTGYQGDTFAAVPEPTVPGLGLLAMLGLTLCRRRCA